MNILAIIAGIVILVGGIVMIVFAFMVDTMQDTDQNVKKAKELKRTLLSVFGCIVVAIGGGCIVAGIHPLKQ